MADRNFMWGGRSPPARRTIDFSGHRRHDQQRLLVELELDDSMYQGTLRAGMEPNTPLQSEGPSTRRTANAADASNRRSFQPMYEQDFGAEPKSRLNPRAPRESATKLLTERQMQQLQARRLSSPYKLKQQVQGTRSDATSHHHRHEPHNRNANSIQRPIRSPTLQQSPAQIVIESIRQNIHLRDQVLAHLQQELMGVLPLHRASHVEKNVPQRVVKLLNRIRSLSLAVVEAVVYLSGELGNSDAESVSVEQEILEHDFYEYLLQMASSDMDFLACSPPLQRFFEDFDVNLTRNPFVDGLSLDSSEVLLCSCHQSSSSGDLFCSASSSSTSLLRLLTHKLETFALQTQRYLQDWQIIPTDRVAAALLHLMDLETRYNVVRMIPKYLQSQGDKRRYLHQHREADNRSNRYGTFLDERMQRVDRQGSRLSYTGGYDTSRSEQTVVEAWAGSPTSKTPAKTASPSSTRFFNPTNTEPDQPLASKPSHGLSRKSSRKDEDTRSASSPGSAWTKFSSPPHSGSARKENPNHQDESLSPSPASAASTSPRSASKTDAETLSTEDSEENGSVAIKQIVPSLDTAALGKLSSRSSQLERTASKKRSRNFDEWRDRSSNVDVGIQMSKPNTPTPSARVKEEVAITRRSASTLSTRTMRDEMVQVYEEGPGNLVSVRRPSLPILAKEELPPDSNNMDVSAGLVITEADFSDSARKEPDDFANCDEPLGLNDAQPEAPPSSFETNPVIFSRGSVDDGLSTFVNVGASPNNEREVESHVECVVENNSQQDDDEYECDFEYSSNKALSSIAMALQMLPSFSSPSVESTLTIEVLKTEDATLPVEAEIVVSSRSERLEADRVESMFPPGDEISSSVGTSPASTSRSTRNEVSVSIESLLSEVESVDKRAEDEILEDDEYAYSSSTAISNIAMALSLLPSVWKEQTLSEEESEPAMESLVDVNSSRTNTYRLIDEAELPIGSLLDLNFGESAANDVTAYLPTPSYDTGVPTLLSEFGVMSVQGSSQAYSSLASSCCESPSPVPSHGFESAILSDQQMPLLPFSSRSSAQPSTSEQAVHSPPASFRSSAQTVRSEQVAPSLSSSSHSNVQTARSGHHPFASSRSTVSTILSDQTISLTPNSSRRSTMVIEPAIHALTTSRSNMSATTSYHGDDESEPSEFNRIFSLCRDIQGAAFDMSHWVSQREVEDHILSVSQPYASLMGYSSPTPIVNTPQYLERELKMLRRNFIYWKQACTAQKRAKQVVRRAIAWRKIIRFIYHHHQRRLQARRDEEHRVRSRAACQIQRRWRIYHLRKEVARRKAAFRLIHMNFHRVLFFVRTSRRRRLREYAKERLVRWWRHQRSRIKKQKQRKEQLARERERRMRALKDIQKFLKEVLLRRKLKAAQALAKNVLFKEQLKWTKAKRDVEKSMKLNSKHRRELIADMNAKLVDLDRRWKSAEEARMQLLTHHERVIQQQQHAVEVRRKRLAAMKIQTFFRVCRLHKKLQQVEMEKTEYQHKLHQELLAKEKLGMEAQKRVGKTRTQVRVLKRKLDRVSLQALETDTRNRNIIQDHVQRQRVSEQRAARQKIKCFVDARVLYRRAASEKHRLLLLQAQLHAEKNETELMSSEDQLEHRRTATLMASELQRRLSDLETRSEALLQASNELSVENELKAQQTAALLEHSRVESSMQAIASWVSGQVRLSKLKKEKEAICALAARTMEEEKLRQHKEIEAKMHEINAIKASNFMNQRISQQRNHRTVEMIRIQQQQKSAQEKAIAKQTRTQLVQFIIAVKLLAEYESSKGVTQALGGVTRFHKSLEQKFARLKYLRSMNCARKIQLRCRCWVHQQRIKRAQGLALAQFEEAKQRQALARRMQAWWRKWAREQQRRREQRRCFEAHLELVRTRANARKVQGAWRRWVTQERERRHEQQQVLDAYLEFIRARANARKLQNAWRRYVERERERRREQQHVFDAHVKAILLRANARKIQSVWRRWVLQERERRRTQQLAFDTHLEAIQLRANARKVQSAWRRWVKRERERRYEQQQGFDAHLSVIRVRANARKIQSVWRRWILHERERRSQQQLAFETHLKSIRVRANVRKIQGAWRCWVAREHERRHQQKLAFNARLKVIRARASVRKIQRVWRCWATRERERRVQQRLAFDKHLETIRIRVNVRKIQGVWTRWVMRERERRIEQQRMFDEHLETIRTRANVRKIQSAWRCWMKREQDRGLYQRQVFDEHLEVIRLRANARKIQVKWRGWVKRTQERRERLRVHCLVFSSAVRIQKWWKNRQRERQAKAERIRILRERSAQVIQRKWMRWHQWQQTAKEKKLKREVCARKLQSLWLQWRQWKRKRERSAKRIQDKWQQHKTEAERKHKVQVASAVVIQQKWRKCQCKQNYEKEKARKLCRLQVSSATLQRACYQWWERRQREKKLELEQQQEEERLQQEYVTNAMKIQTFWRKEQKQKGEQRDKECLVQAQNASSLKIQRNWGSHQYRRKLERERIQHEQHISAFKIQTVWLKWHHEQQEELERERIRQEQYESSLKIQRSWGISQRRQKVAQERLRHRQNLSALKIQKHWRRRRHLHMEQRLRKRSQGEEPKNSRTSSIVELKVGQPVETLELKPEAEQLDQDEQGKLEAIKRRSFGWCIARAVNNFHQHRRETSAATRIEAIWKGKVCRQHYLDALEAKRVEEARQYRLMVSVFATKVQVCWRRWHSGVQQRKRSVVKDDELRLIQETRMIEHKVLLAGRSFAAKRIQRAIVSRRKLPITPDAPKEIPVTEEEILDHQELVDMVIDEDPANLLGNDEPVDDLMELVETPEENTVRVVLEKTVEDWSHRELPHILTRSVNQILFCHDAASVIQKFIRAYQKRRRMQFSFQRSLAKDLDEENPDHHFRFYFKRASGWLEWHRSKSIRPLCLRFDSQMTRKLLQLFEPSEEYLMSEIQKVLQELAADSLPLLTSPECLQDNENLRPELCYHDVDEMELSRSLALLRQMGQRRAQIRRQQLLEVDTSFWETPVSLPSPVARSTPSSPSKKEVTIFTAVENASVEDATFLQHRGADLAAVEPKMQRNVLHMLSFSKESYRLRAETLEFLLICGANLNVNAVDCNGDTPLMLYASLGHLSFMQKLLEHGADIQMTNRKGQNVLHRACEYDQVEVCGFLQQLMMKDSVAESILLPETISALAPASLTLHFPDSAGRYPVHCLAEKGFVDCAKQLVVPTEANYEWNRVLQAQGDAQGRTALHSAVLTHDIAMTAFLLTPGGGSDVNAFDDLHRSPVHYAVESPAALSIISRLVQHGANLNVADERGDTPLHWAAFSGCTAVAQNLLALGADPTLVNSDWETPAQIAAAYGQLDCMRLLLQSQRKFGAAFIGDPKEQKQQVLVRPASEKTALQRLEEAVNHLHEKQAAARSYHAHDEVTDLDALSTSVADGDSETTPGGLAAEQSHGGYWEELHQDVQLVEESGQFSSEDEEDALFGDD